VEKDSRDENKKRHIKKRRRKNTVPRFVYGPWFNGKKPSNPRKRKQGGRVLMNQKREH